MDPSGDGLQKKGRQGRGKEERIIVNANNLLY